MICADFNQKSCLVACKKHEILSGRCSCFNRAMYSEMSRKDTNIPIDDIKMDD